MTITAPAGKIPVLNVLGDSTYAPHPFTPNPMVETSNVYTTSFTMQDEDVTVDVRFEDEPGPDERYVTLTVRGPAGSGDAEMSDSNAVPTTTGAVSVGNWSQIKSKLGDTVTITVNPSTGYAVAFPNGVEVDGGVIPVTQTGPH